MLDALLDRVLDPEHLEQLLANLFERSDDADRRRRRQLATARTSRTEADKAIGGLLRLVENGTMPADSREVVERIAFQRARQQAATTEIEIIERQLSISRKRMTPAIIAEFGRMLRAKLIAGDPISGGPTWRFSLSRSRCPPMRSASPAPTQRSSTCSSAINRRSAERCPSLTGNGAPQRTKMGTQIVGQFRFRATVDSRF